MRFWTHLGPLLRFKPEILGTEFIVWSLWNFRYSIPRSFSVRYLGFCIQDVRSLKSLSLFFSIFILSIWGSVFSMWGFWTRFWFYVPCFEKCLAYYGQGVRSLTFLRVCVSEFEFVGLGNLCSRYEVPENLRGSVFQSFNLRFFYSLCSECAVPEFFMGVCPIIWIWGFESLSPECHLWMFEGLCTKF